MKIFAEDLPKTFFQQIDLKKTYSHSPFVSGLKKITLLSNRVALWSTLLLLANPLMGILITANHTRNFCFIRPTGKVHNYI